MTRYSDITLIGGGIIGLLTARELHQAGVRVTLIERNRIGQESSWAGGGILLPLYPWRQPDAISRLVIRSLALYPSLAEQLIRDTQLDPEWTPCGLLISKNPDIQAAIRWCKDYSIRYETPGLAFFNELNTQPENPLWLPYIAQARNPRLVKSLRQDLGDKGVRIIEECELKSVYTHQHRITEIDTAQGKFPVEQLIVSAGAWTGQLFTRLFPIPAPDIVPVKGQMLLFDAKPDTLRHMVLDEDRYLIPRRDGKILAGSSVEHDQFDKTPSAEIHDKLKNFALALMPSLKRFPIINHWAGLRPGTEHGVPYIGRHPEIENLFINAGHFRNGLAMGPASAELLADLILNRTPRVAPEPYQFSSLH
ncbi:glycine oxidase ThiO [Methylomicrobium sp. Wu6]|uniref:glycine oxidase ThiO n=1 Tax=Methylomicrobium sp. Wu6 TaxID=3107928 RepID=UPI002DD693CA|nr:glycine oxidase ThiO [Methylomicrobium sp. Wu6]MEC4748338.1 glycine oxidase ThiO [Methylomicrobium sp. Wu6]